MGFKEWLSQNESTPRTRAAMGIYPHYPDHAFARPPYSYIKFVDYISRSDVKTHNIKKPKKKRRKNAKH